jgi:L-amino acid N-acyltransferase YncA
MDGRLELNCNSRMRTNVRAVQGHAVGRPTVRHANLRDLPRIVEIYNAAIPSGRSTGDSEPTRPENQVGWFKQHDRRSRPMWVVEQNRIVVGWAGLCSFYERLAFLKTAELSVYIAPAHQRCGFGRRLVERIIKSGPSLGVDTLLGFVFAHNGPMIDLLECLGFVRWGCLPGVAEVHSVRRDLLILGRPLPQASFRADYTKVP